MRRRDEQKNLIDVMKFLQARSEGKPYDIQNISLGYAYEFDPEKITPEPAKTACMDEVGERLR